MMLLAGRLHDIGKVAVPDAILQKPARLSEEEWVQMKRHPVVGAEVLAHIPSLRPLTPMIRAHHERWDGMGYPDQLQGEQIPLAARMITIVDAYIAMVVDRPYQQGRSAQEALVELRRCAGTQFDPVIVEALCALLQASLLQIEVQVA
jgi:HD-GYP domain-containing protein (c-di-GMP phosphodiesterase class II)